MTFQLEVWSKTEDIVQTLLQVCNNLNKKNPIVAPGLRGNFQLSVLTQRLQNRAERNCLIS